VNPRTPTDSGEILRQVFHPPVREWQYWVIQLTVVLIAGLHLSNDTGHDFVGAIPAGIPVALLIVPVGYAAVRYGLAGSAATSVLATILWLPDLIVPHGHLSADIIDLVMIDVVAIVFGQRIESERFARSRAERETAERIAAEQSYRLLFESNRAPIVVVDSSGRILDANPAARTLRESANDLHLIQGAIEGGGSIVDLNGRTVRMSNGQDYRIGIVDLPGRIEGAATQLVFEDVTAELRESRRATEYARLVIKVEEEQRRRLARELHDEPLQLFLHLARRLESLGSKAGVPDGVSSGLDQARLQALDAAARLRVLARDLRPPALDRLGLVPALSSLLSDVEEETTLSTSISVVGDPVRIGADLELGAFRIIQESVNNAIKHANAQNIDITVGFNARTLELSVRDDGDGFEIDGIDEQSSSGMGLMGMRERAVILAGRLDIESVQGRGTTVSAVLPLAAVESPH
jgi:signal transduction histidine kinase